MFTWTRHIITSIIQSCITCTSTVTQSSTLCRITAVTLSVWCASHTTRRTCFTIFNQEITLTNIRRAAIIISRFTVTFKVSCWIGSVRVTMIIWISCWGGIMVVVAIRSTIRAITRVTLNLTLMITCCYLYDWIHAITQVLSSSKTKIMIIGRYGVMKIYGMFFIIISIEIHILLHQIWSILSIPA